MLAARRTRIGRGGEPGTPCSCLRSLVNVPETQEGQTVGVDRQEEFVLGTLEERDVRFVRLWFTDVIGYLKSVAVAPAELEGAFAEGIGFDGSAGGGLAAGEEAGHVRQRDAVA